MICANVTENLARKFAVHIGLKFKNIIFDYYISPPNKRIFIEYDSHTDRDYLIRRINDVVDAINDTGTVYIRYTDDTDEFINISELINYYVKNGYEKSKEYFKGKPIMVLDFSINEEINQLEYIDIFNK